MALLKTENPSSVATNRAPIYSRCSRSFFALLFIGLLLFTVSLRAQPTTEYKIKAAYLFNFAQFVEWPPEAFSDPKAPLVIGILGADPFGSFLDELVQNEVVRDRPVEIRRFRTLDEVQSCHVLFISSSEKDHMDQVLSRMRNRSTLTVSDWEGFAKFGGIVKFITEKNKIRFRINLDAAQAARIVISSKLLRAAEITKTEKEK